ncbi:uncharacterized protein LOC110616551 isoform X1 [Manihot esculenta]|uniref:Rad60/SUMO-like domain-containing protein n=4 Tax=Manihot esculenta TaxID=3983 RepID=A0A251KM02_MANES|nr:uncharacterized protein LOC110616551 isoform X1 [Manihot esculenta]XP_021614641.1 uncharacterized protein LOC110616551 isoform X1 [Manihot esculenta]KAG8652209.1 hypothetical protein MANES_06G064100v8 [Manihot esculenta]OAY47247.1 hypothetical protein MANES_06G064100v8 [Manihot esculenta]OAY47248.1 hypothetical protein MANES_06G064100v8 [Manihot esculenta]
MEDSMEELEPLFDYRRVQPLNFVCLDDDDGSDTSPLPAIKRRKTFQNPKAIVKEVDDEDVEVVGVKCKDKDEEDWLPPPPKVSCDFGNRLGEDSTIKELRLKKQELESLANSGVDVLQAVEESVKKELSGSLKAALHAVSEQPLKPPCERAKIVISVQDKDELKQFRIYKDDNFERLFKLYADKVKLNIQNLVFSFDGDKISPTASPDSLGMEDEDIIEVHVKKSE